MVRRVEPVSPRELSRKLTPLYPECKHLLSRMLVTDPKQRATMAEVMNHQWMIKGYGGPPENYLPHREPVTLPLEPEVIAGMSGFNFGSPEAIKLQLTRVIESEDYQRALRAYQREKELPTPAKDAEKRRGFGFDFYKRRNSANSRDNLSAPSTEGLQLGDDPLNAYNPLISIYQLVREKQDRDRLEVRPGLASQPGSQKDLRDKDSAPPEITLPPEAHTNTATYEMPGEKATGGRSRPRARTHGEDDAPEMVKQKQSQLSPAAAQAQTYDGHADVPPKKESTAAGILRRFSTRRRREPERLDKDRAHPPVVQVLRAQPEAPAPARKSFSIRRSRRDRDDAGELRIRSGSSQPPHDNLLSPPLSAGEPSHGRRSGLGRSTSVNSAVLRRHDLSHGANEPPPTSGSDQSAATDKPRPDSRRTLQQRSASVRTKSLGHARRESIQQRRLRREEAREANVPEEVDEMADDQSGGSSDEVDRSDLAKPVFLKGLFSVSTTSGKPVPEIRADIKRVLKNLGVEYTQIKGGFLCRHTPSIDLKTVHDMPGSPAQTPGHRRRFSFGGIMGSGDRDRDDGPTTPRTPMRAGDNGHSHSEISVGSIDGEPVSVARRVAGETTTRVQSDLGGNMVIVFEIFIVKVPLLSLHGIQFKHMAGNTWQYKNMADQILRDLRL